MPPTTPQPTPQTPPPQRKPFSRRRVILLVTVGTIILLALAGLFWFLRVASDPNKPLSGASKSTIVRLHAWRCEKSDGTQYFSDSGVYRCGWGPTSDAGKSCTGSSQCEAGCICDSDVATEDCFQCAPYRLGSSAARYEDRYPSGNGNTNVAGNQNINTNTAGWKTYVNAGEGFSFQYPPDYWVEKNGSEGNETFWVNLTSPQTVSIKAGTGGAQSDAISFQPHMTATALAEIFGSPSPIQDTLSFYQSLGLPTNERTVTLGGRAGFQADVSELNTVRYTFTKNAAGDYFVISQIQVETTNGEVNATQYYETILSTFTFLDTSKSNPYSLDSLKVGDQVANMKVAKIEKASPSVSLPLSIDNAKVTFIGQETITGKFEYYKKYDGIMGGNVCIIEVDQEFSSVIPRLIGDTRTSWFCFSNIDFAKQQFGPEGSTGRATFVIDVYVDVYLAAEVVNSAKLVRVISK